MSRDFSNFQECAFRVEGLSIYREANGSLSEGYRAWIEGCAPKSSFNEEWASFVRSAIARGARIQRLRLVSSPLSDYEEYELMKGYLKGIEAGEEIRVMQRSSPPELNDAWYFDSQGIVEQIYGPDGRFIKSITREMLPEDTDNLMRALSIFAHALPIDKFLDSLKRD